MSSYIACISTMERKVLDNHALLSSKVPLIIINQCSSQSGELIAADIEHIQGNNVTFYNYHERGLSKSRNRAIEHAQADWIIIGDDDVLFYDDALRKLLNEAKESDIVVFSNADETGPKFRDDENDFRLIFSAASWCIAVRREFVQMHDLKFDERFGLGAPFISTEENSFLWDAKRLGARMKSSDAAVVNHTGVSTGYVLNHNLWKSKGAFFARNLGFWGIPVGVAFVVKKSISHKLNFVTSLKSFIDGFREFKRIA